MVNPMRLLPPAGLSTRGGEVSHGGDPGVFSSLDGMRGGLDVSGGRFQGL